MRVSLKMSGSQYGQGKDDFKALLKKHGLSWKGTMMRPWWGNEKEKVVAEYERDDAKDVTISATLTWVGEGDTPFLTEMRAWARGLGLEPSSAAGDGAASTVEGDDLFFWDMVHKPMESELQARGCPDRWIQLEIEHWRRDRARRMGGGPL